MSFQLLLFTLIGVIALKLLFIPLAIGAFVQAIVLFALTRRIRCIVNVLMAAIAGAIAWLVISIVANLTGNPAWLAAVQDEVPAVAAAASFAINLLFEFQTRDNDIAERIATSSARKNHNDDSYGGYPF